jgi:hypothetical protein
MDQSTAVWFLIALALVTANLPFIAQRPLLALPWAQRGEQVRPFWWLWLESLVFFCLLVALGYGTLELVGRAVIVGSDIGSIFLFLITLAGVFIVAALLLAYPGWRNRGRVVVKSFFARLLELLVLYGLVGMLGFAFEANIGNSFSQTWEFYSITVCLMLVLGYPGFVYRYLMRHHKPGRPSKGQGKPA